MKALTFEEFKEVCRYIHNCGKRGESFEATFQLLLEESVVVPSNKPIGGDIWTPFEDHNSNVSVSVGQIIPTGVNIACANSFLISENDG